MILSGFVRLHGVQYGSGGLEFRVQGGYGFSPERVWPTPDSKAKHTLNPKVLSLKP